MAMNLCHRVFCSSNRYFDAVEGGLLPWVLADVDLGDNVLEIGPGYGGTNTGLPAEEFSSVVCFTMLHHVPTPALQDQLLAEAFRVLRPGGVFAGSDSAASTLFRLLHFRDTCNPVHPQAFPEHLRAAGFDDVHVEANGRRLRWRAVKAGS
jgi:SAM-dependent methyltransferase